VCQGQKHNEPAPQLGHGTGAQGHMALGQLRADLAHGLGVNKELAPDINQDVVTVAGHFRAFLESPLPKERDRRGCIASCKSAGRF